MTLAEQYSIAVRHQRSTRIDSDLSVEFFSGLVYHGTAQTALESLLRQYEQTAQTAYTLTGPYGSGKSTIALLLTGLLNADQDVHNAAYKTINEQTQALLSKSIPYDKGWLQIRSVGGVNTPVDAFWNATLQALKDHPLTADLSNKYQKILPKNEAELISHWESLFIEVKPFVDGVLILADEMGKTLEYINKNKGELHLFQDLAEVLGRVKTPIIFLGLLHQAFSDYAKDRGTKLQEEWGKIQGRYADIPYSVSTDETVALIAQSIVPSKAVNKDTTRYVDMTLNAIASLDNNKNRIAQLSSRLKNAAPLHPLVALILGPISKRRFSQNERSTFGFLNSHEQYSFQMFLKNHSDCNDRYSLHHLWDYLETNLEHTILGSPDGRGWAEASEAINRVDVPETTLNILKSIALISLFGKPAKLYPTELTLQAAVGIEDVSKLRKHLSLLQSVSAIIFRKYQSSWLIYEGSDLDIPSLLEDKIEQLTKSNEAIENIKFSQQIIAKGHYHTFGNLRWAEQSLLHHLDSIELDKITPLTKGEFANFVLLMSHIDDEKLVSFTKDNPTIALANAFNSSEIQAYAKEVYALELLKADKDIGSTLVHDKVAQKEYESRLSYAQKMLWTAIDEGFTNSSWITRGKKQEILSLSEIASDLADDIYFKSPSILNELVNRNKLSGTAVSARKKLLEAMLDHSDKQNLGITGFPPEISMYISCLKSTNLHIEKNGVWQLSTEQIPSKLKGLFDTTTDYLKTNAGNKINLGDIESLWTGAPYGLSSGVFPILVFAYLQTLGQDIAFYEKAMSGDFEFISEPDLDYVLKLQKSPKELAVKFIKLEEKDQEWLQLLASYAATLTSRPVNTNLLSVATPFVTTMHGLSYWVKNANNLIHNNPALNNKVIRLRDAFLHANDPHELLINKVVQVIDKDNNKTFTERVDEIESCVSILKSAHEKMLSHMNSKIKQIFPETGDRLISMCQIVEEKSGDLRLRSFARELGKSQEFGLKWLESLIAVVVGRGIQNWNEANLLTAEQKISDYAQDFLRIVKASNTNTPTETQNNIETKNISLVLEETNGLVNYTKEIKLTNNPLTQEMKSAIQSELTSLSEFERIDILHQLLKEALVAQS
ncbi:hypothetical protein [Photobacterium angustum]|uniref:ATP-binding protein n=1 Tax=Photobacterium angustum TaxID=661 RepID=A0A855S8G5_PHOAN|nr:hypothetical protein [Photobacterium angustum]KJF81619.1 hypothetical protein UB36_11305 [Photobacterium damselae subsp. damselae]KJG40872.1 hypothetical protein UA35_11950 [Photobacterium angustum]KJG45265.1 hypothetical protein UA31_11310 [Photobacterium angustum]KJG48777.1 hypothetical protein UA30_11720 [Photobacterium angustum]KJG52496.1 hypothetical protein UA34_13340 [Photobacterium angustum]